ncbi:MAG TPA: serine/threonine-protein kinase [Polyangiales bacterium]
MLSRGDMIKDYEIIAPLRSGGMALVYLARRRGVGGFNRLVVLKLVHPDLVEDAKMTSLFLAEARLSAQVAHPNVVHVEELGKLGRTYFIAMEYVHGVTLSELLAILTERKQRMDPKLCVWIAAQLAEALHAVHEALGENDAPLLIVHRDVSPQNVLVGLTGHVKLIDFGIAKSLHAEDSTTHGRVVLGKLGYMAPEQLRRETVDRRTDVYALGVMLWEMLCARSLFRCQRIDDERDWATREQPPSAQAYARISEALDRVVKRALAPDPRDRFGSAFAFRAALLQAMPECMQVDAPRFAALMHTLIGDELARRREGWPVDVGMQLELDAELTTQKSFAIEELTAEHDIATELTQEDSGIITQIARPAKRSDPDPFDFDDPTGDPTRVEGTAARDRVRTAYRVLEHNAPLAPIFATEPAPLRIATAEAALAVPSSLRPTPSEGALVAVPESIVITQATRPVGAVQRMQELLRAAWSSRSARAGALAGACTVLGVMLGVSVKSVDAPSELRRHDASFHASPEELTGASADSVGDASQRYASTSMRRTRVLAGPVAGTADAPRRRVTAELKRSSKLESKHARATKAQTRGRLGGHLKTRSRYGR